MKRFLGLGCMVMLGLACGQPLAASAMASTCSVVTGLHAAGVAAAVTPARPRVVLTPLQTGLWHGLMRQAARVIAGVDIDAPSERRRAPAAFSLPDRQTDRVKLVGEAA